MRVRIEVGVRIKVRVWGRVRVRFRIRFHVHGWAYGIGTPLVSTLSLQTLNRNVSCTIQLQKESVETSVVLSP